VIAAATDAVADESLTAYASRASVEAALDPVESVASRDSTGGPAPDAVAEGLDVVTNALTTDRDTLETRRERLAASAETLEREVASYV
jgi:argininosuccinate lyase